METLFKILMAIFYAVFSPISVPVNRNVSTSYYYGKFFPALYYSQTGNWFELGWEWMPKASLFTFNPISENFAKDSTDVFFKQHRITEWVDYPTFTINRGIPIDAKSAYRIDDDNGRLYIARIQGADPKTFEFLSQWRSWAQWHRDKNSYYRNWQKVGVERETFEATCDFFYKDKYSVYVDDGEVLRKFPCSPTRFRRLTRDSCTDGEFIFRFERHLKDKISKLRFPAEKNRIIATDQNYIIYTGAVIYHGAAIPQADARSFVVLSEFYAKDKFRAFFDGKPLIGAEATSFSVDSLYSAHDSKAWYCREKRQAENLPCN